MVPVRSLRASRRSKGPGPGATSAKTVDLVWRSWRTRSGTLPYWADQPVARLFCHRGSAAPSCRPCNTTMSQRNGFAVGHAT